MANLPWGLEDYGNEVESGQGVARALKEGIVKREELFLVSKLWNSFHDAERVEPICKKQLQDWGIDYFDLYIMHFPISLKYVDPSERYPPGFTYDGENVVQGTATIQETWTAMESLVRSGLARSIGISNFNAALIMDLRRYAQIVPAALQIEHHPYLTQATLVDFVQSQGIAVTAYSSFGPQSFRELDMQRAVDAPLLFDHEVVKKAASRHGKSPAQVLLRWATQRNIAVVPKSNNPDRLAQNLDVTGWDLSREEVEELSGLNKGLRFNDPLLVSSTEPVRSFFFQFFFHPSSTSCHPIDTIHTHPCVSTNLSLSVKTFLSSSLASLSIFIKVTSSITPRNQMLIKTKPPSFFFPLSFLSPYAFLSSFFDFIFLLSLRHPTNPSFLFFFLPLSFFVSLTQPNK